MRKWQIMLILICLIPVSASAMEFTAPPVPEAGAEFMPASTDSFSDALLELIQNAARKLRPDLAEAAYVSSQVFGTVLMLSLCATFSGNAKLALQIAGTAALTILLIRSTNTMLVLAEDTVQKISQYGKLLLPVMTGAMAAQGGVTSSTALYIGTAFFDTLLGSLLSRFYIPMVYLYLAFSIAGSATEEGALKKLRDMIKGLLSWCLKTILMVFTSYMSITGVVSGTTDAAALKATKLTISTLVPMVGGILSDASEAVLVGASVMKNAAGIYGILAVLAICIGPFLKIGAHYLMLKLTVFLCSVFSSGGIQNLVEDFSSALGMMLAITGAMCLLLLISIVCFLKGVGG